MLTQEHKDWRRVGIGGSDARTIALGTGDDWAALRREKVEGIEPEFSKQTQLLMKLGNAVEPVCIAEAALRIGEPLEVDVRQESATDPFFRCTLDAKTITGLPVQCKFHTGDKSIEDLVEFYWPQLQHEMFVTDSNTLYFAVIFGHYGRFEMETVERDQLFLDSYLLRAFQFREYLKTGVLPDGMEESKPKANIVRGRDHVWPTNDNQVSSLAIDWINNKDAAKKFNDAVKAIKDLVPEDARSAKWVRDGVGIMVSVNKAGSKSIKEVVEKL